MKASNLITTGNAETAIIQNSHLLIELSLSDILFKKNTFVYDPELENQFVTGITKHGIKGFVEWLNNLLNPINVDSISFRAQYFE